MARILSGCGQRGIIPLPADQAPGDPWQFGTDISSFFGSLR